MEDIMYDPYRPAIPFDTLLVPIYVLLQCLWLHSSSVTNDGLGGQIWTCNSKIIVGEASTALCMIHIEQLFHLTHCWYPYMFMFSPFHSICHQWQMRWPLPTTNMNMQQQKINGLSFWIQGKVWSIYTSFTIWHIALPIQFILQPLWLNSSQVRTSDGHHHKYEHATATWFWALH
jgi:hypothetical protein